MVQIEHLAEAALQGESLRLRSLVQDFLKENTQLTNVIRPSVNDLSVLAVSASFLELFAERLGQEIPTWTQAIGPVVEPIFLLKSASTMKHLRTLCESEAPEPLRKRRLYAPPNYLEFV